MLNRKTISTALTLTIILIFASCSGNSYTIEKADWKFTDDSKLFGYTVVDAQPSSKGKGTMDIEFYGWEKKGTIVSAYSSNEMKNTMGILEQGLQKDTAITNLGKGSVGYARIDVDKLNNTSGTYEAGLPVFRFKVK